jgi:predicted nucleic acid-binding protein
LIVPTSFSVASSGRAFCPTRRRPGVFELFDEHVRDFFLRIHLDEGHLSATRELPSRAPKLLRTLDALHLAAAVDAGGALATFDDRLAEVGRSLGIQVLS